MLAGGCNATTFCCDAIEIEVCSATSEVSSV
jgi:hypothetical protein